jgi:hypothetical protein
MKIWILSAVALLIGGLPAAAWDIDQHEEIQKSFSFSGAPHIIVDNVNGSIHVKGVAGNEARMLVHKRLRADSTGKAEEAERDVRLDISQDGNTLRLYVDGPFRCKDGGVHMHGRQGYEVTYDFELEAPRQASVELKTINDGDIQVDDVAGDYQVKNINGGIEMSELAGSGKVYALNGRVRVTFRSNPRTESSFGSLNGEVRVSFQPDLNADLRFKTFNGGVYTDFPVTYLPAAAGSGERHNGRFVYKSNEWSAARVGRGGPEISFDAFNGNIRILSRGQ